MCTASIVSNVLHTGFWWEMIWIHIYQAGNGTEIRVCMPFTTRSTAALSSEKRVLNSYSEVCCCNIFFAFVVVAAATLAKRQLHVCYQCVCYWLSHKPRTGCCALLQSCLAPYLEIQEMKEENKSYKCKVL